LFLWVVLFLLSNNVSHIEYKVMVKKWFGQVMMLCVLSLVACVEDECCCCDDDFKPIVNPTGSHNGHDWVDLGLPSGLKWAVCNVGADSPEGYGFYFAWGETSYKNEYKLSEYKYGSAKELTKYCTKSSYGKDGFTDSKVTLDLSDDAARVNWEGSWRMPTKAELDELREHCTWTLTALNNVKGYQVISNTNGNSIFLPAAGYYGGLGLNYTGSFGYYWSGSLDSGNPFYAFGLHFSADSTSNATAKNIDRYYGLPVRPVFHQE
jgi:hypothetical protein